MAGGSDRWCIVGAGAAGLCAARWLKQLEVPFEVLERHPNVGGIWDISSPGSPMYESCHFISSRSRSGFRDYPLPDEYPDYPRHDLVLRYLQGYARHHRLRSHIQFATEITAAKPTASGWDVTLASGEARSYAGLIAAAGNEWRPYRAALPGEFTGEVIHSSEYTSPSQLNRRRVLIVGAGNSGCDIAVDAAGHALRAALSMRRGYWFIPKHILGKPSDVFAASGPRLPGWLERPVLETLLRVLVGDLRRYGLPKPDHRIFETHPILNSRIIECLSHGDLEPKSDIARCEGRTVHFEDGSRGEFDLIILATGFRHGVPFIDDELLPDDDVSPLLVNLLHRQVETLYVVGHFTTDGAAFPLIDLQCELLSRLIVIGREAPEAAAAFRERLIANPPDFTNGVRFKPIRRMSDYVRFFSYKRFLEGELARMS